MHHLSSRFSPITAASVVSHESARHRLQRQAGVFALILTGLIGIPLHAAIITVTTLADDAAVNGNCTLREAVQAANLDATFDGCLAGAGADSIRFAAGLTGGTIPLTFVADTSYGPSALAIISSLTIDGSAAPRLSISRDTSVANLRLFIVKSGASLTLRDITLSGGSISGYPGGGGSAGLGGAIFNDGTLLIERVTLSGNTARGGNGAGGSGTGGGGLGTPGFAGNPETNGGAGGGPNGGAGGDPSVDPNGQPGGVGGGGGGGGGAFSLGNAGAGGFGGGGGNPSGVIVIISGNAGTGGFGGGGGGVPDYPDQVFEGAGGFGGGNGGGGAGGGGAGLGGAIFSRGPLTLRNSTLSGNQTSGGASTGGGGSAFGGAVFSVNAPVTVITSTLAGNSLSGGGGATPGQAAGGALYALQFAGASMVRLSNSIFADSTGGSDVFIDGRSISGSRNVVERSPNLPAAVILTTADPKLAALNDYGGPTFTRALGANSPALNAGDCDGAAVTTDQRGFARPAGGVACDLGAFEEDPLKATQVTIAGPLSGLVGQPVNFTATAAPSTATLPITFTWSASGQTGATHTVNSLTDPMAFSWPGAGQQSVTVTAANGTFIPTATRMVMICTDGDTDSDGLCNAQDNCPAVFNPGQEDIELSGVLALWRLNEGSGSTAADSTGLHQGTLLGGATWTTGRFGGAVALDGVNGTISIPHSSALKPAAAITLSAWVKPVNFTADVTYEIYRKDDGTERNLLSFSGNGTQLKFGISTGGSYAELIAAITPAQFTDGAWHFVAATYDGAMKRLYKDGVEIANVAATGPIGTGGATAAYIGSWNEVAEFFNGAIDDVTLYSRALSAAEIQTSYLNGNVGDGVGDVCDNCPLAYNPLQQNADGDARGDACDCAPANPGLWSAPSPVLSLNVRKTAPQLFWTAPADPGATSLTYDVISGTDALPNAFTGVNAVCVATNTAATSASTAAGSYYIVRAKNTCGTAIASGTYPSTAPVPARTCP